MIKKLFILNFSLIVFFTLGAVAKVNAQEITNHSIEVIVNPDGTNEAKIIQKFTLSGNDNSNLSSGVTVEVPYNNIRLNSIRANNRNTTFSIGDNKVFINLKNVLLRKNETANIVMDFNVIDAFYDVWNYKVLKIKSPTLGDKYDFNIINNSGYNKLKFINTEDNQLSGKRYGDILTVFGPDQTNSYSYKLNYSNLDPKTILPVVSDNIGLNYISHIEGSNLGVSDKSGNYFLIYQEELVLEGEIKRSFEINTFPFENLNTQIKVNSISDISRTFNDIEADTTIDYVNDYSINLNESKKLNSIEFAILASKLFSKLQIPNRVVYGVVNHPDNYQFAHYWVEYKFQEQVLIFDPFINKLLNVTNKSTYPIRFTVGIIDQESITNLNNISYIQELNFSEVNFINTKENNVLGVESTYIDLIRSQADSVLTVHNNSNNYLNLLGASNLEINNEIEKLLILPNLNQNFPLFSSNEEEVEFYFKINNNNFSKKFEINKTTDFRSFYTQISILIFTLTSIIFISIRFLIRFNSETRILKKLNNTLIMKIRNINESENIVE